MVFVLVVSMAARGGARAARDSGVAALKLATPDLADTLLAVGGVIVVVGVALLLHVAAALIVAGIELILAGLVLSRRI